MLGLFSRRTTVINSVIRSFATKQSVPGVHALLKLRPSLLIDNEEYPISTGYKHIDELLQNRLLLDKTDVRGIFEYSDYKVYDLYYKKEDQRFVVTLSRSDGTELTHADGIIIDNQIVDPDDAGPDTWMEGNHTYIIYPYN